MALRKTIIFDLDGTLVDSMPDFLDEVTAFLKADGQNLVSPEEISQFLSGGIKGFLEKFFTKKNTPLTETEINQKAEHYSDFYAGTIVNKTKLYPDVKETLELFKNENFKLAICTNRKHISAFKILEKTGIKDFFDVILTFESTEKPKPDPSPILAIIASTKADKAIMIGDAPIDINSAKAAKIPSIAMTYGYSHIPYSKLGADFNANAFSEIIEIIKNC